MKLEKGLEELRRLASKRRSAFLGELRLSIHDFATKLDRDLSI